MTKEELINEAVELLTQKKILTEEDKELSSAAMKAYLERVGLLGGKTDQMDCMMSVAFIMGWIKAKESEKTERPKLSIVDAEERN
jgi:hypothetical protein